MYPNMKIRGNRSWDNWGTHGLLFGSLLIFLGLVIQVLEFPRIYNGPTDRPSGTPLYTDGNYFNHWWPWTYAASLFGLLTLLTGVVGVVAGRRRSYASILAFFIMCILSTLMAIYLIVYFSFIIAYYGAMNKDKPAYRTSEESVAYGLAGTQLALACLNVLLSLVAAIFAGRAIALCTPKGVYYEDVQPIPYGTYLTQR